MRHRINALNVSVPPIRRKLNMTHNKGTDGVLVRKNDWLVNCFRTNKLTSPLASPSKIIKTSLSSTKPRTPSTTTTTTATSTTATSSSLSSSGATLKPTVEPIARVVDKPRS
eukprot:TRINITY_DN450_c0_g1_i2.p3 TRINITY_DN450_c0_g1~~TRINITY_DN450_c0_g1_i2.p3  ORF type:complete len:112 (-),score=16.99 TRINITY_DN450_c0_g1_i2:1261-1596(-)